jgi:heme/copper-type cytochrome/quinol oxidase subunit 2
MPFRVADAIFWVACACCVIAQAAIVRSVIISPASRQSADGPMSTSSPASRARRGIDIAWAIIPGLALALVLFYTWSAMHATTSVIGGVVS